MPTNYRITKNHIELFEKMSLGMSPQDMKEDNCMICIKLTFTRNLSMVMKL